MSRLGVDTKPGTYAITEDSGDYNIDGVKMTASGTLILLLQETLMVW